MGRTGFSMVELAITVAIIGILAAIAIPAMQDAQYKAKRAEVPPILSGVGDAEVAYYATHSSWIEGVTNPGTALTRELRGWNPTLAGWRQIGFAPDGLVRCNYSINCQGGGTCDGAGAYVRVQATCDMDDDNVTARSYLYVANGHPACCGSFEPGELVYATPNLY